ncbi:MAG: hypothetical protein RLZZ627_2095, partial [Pseudomonadota bacterium]
RAEPVLAATSKASFVFLIERPPVKLRLVEIVMAPP